MTFNKKIYFNIKEIVLYLFGISFFTNFHMAKYCVTLMFFFIIVDIFLFKEKIELGNERIKKFIIIFIILGIFWNFFADFNYKAARAFFKINRYFIIVFFISSLVKNKKVVLKYFLISVILSYLQLFFKGIDFYIKNRLINYYRFGEFEGVMDVAILTSVVGAFSCGLIISKNNFKYKLCGLILFIISCFLLMLTQTRGALLSLSLSILVMLFLSKKIKVICSGIAIGLVVLGLFFQMPQSARFKYNVFNTSTDRTNMSNGLRIEMWKNAIWRFKQHPILGSGTKQDQKLFDEYVNNMPEKTEDEKLYKNIFKNGYDDAHNMYLNALTDNGIFFVLQIILIFVIVLWILLKNKNYRYSLSLVGSFISYWSFGITWPLWRHGWDPMLLWTLIGLTICSYNFENTKDELEGK
ncbi:O-antigen ligase family protein [Fusobacterium sp.]|uniref:O-antigen ligase family protein n=1 Tax=Fusobacterium sp. TaxID=68766 RepID=UPI00396CE7E2